MEKFFNNAGPQIPADHYTLDPLTRVNLAELQGLIDQKRYFVLHAPRQTGKTTVLYALMQHYNAGHNAGTRYRCVYVNVEPAQALGEQVEAVNIVCAEALGDAAETQLQDLGLKNALIEGQPWLVNALGYEVTYEMQANRERSRPITAEVMREAKERLVLSRAAHLDQLVDKLQEERVYCKPLAADLTLWGC